MSELPDQGAPPGEVPAQGRGARLRAAREAAGLSREDVASRLRLSVRQVQALEDEEADALPSGPFVKGFVRNYARMLGRDAADFEADRTPAPSAAATPPSLTPPQPPRRVLLESGRASANRRWLTAALLCLAVGGLGSWLTMEHLKTAGDLIARQAQPSLAQLGALVGTRPEGAAAGGTPPRAAGTPADVAGTPAGAAAPAAPAAEAPAPAPAPSGAAQEPGRAPAPVPSSAPAPATAAALPAADQAAPLHHLDLAASTALAGAASTPAAHVAPVTASAAAGRKLALDFDADCWVEVRDENNQVLWSGLSRAGEHRDIEAHGPVRIVVGNAPATRLSWNGRPVDLAEFTRLTVARLTLDPASDNP